jgi:hypothetical protein
MGAYVVVGEFVEFMMCELYVNEFWTAEQIGAQFLVSKTVVWRILKARGVKARPKGWTQRHYLERWIDIQLRVREGGTMRERAAAGADPVELAMLYGVAPISIWRHLAYLETREWPILVW